MGLRYRCHGPWLNYQISHQSQTLTVLSSSNRLMSRRRIWWRVLSFSWTIFFINWVFQYQRFFCANEYLNSCHRQSPLLLCYGWSKVVRVQVGVGLRRSCQKLYCMMTAESKIIPSLLPEWNLSNFALQSTTWSFGPMFSGYFCLLGCASGHKRCNSF